MADLGTSTPPQPAPGVAKYQRLLASGFSAEEANQWEQRTTQKLQQGGFTQGEINAYWGTGSPQSATVNAYVGGNMQRAGAQPDPMSSLAAGWNHSVIGLMEGLREGKRLQDLGAPPQSGFWNKLTYSIGQMAGDTPTFLYGFSQGAGPGAVAGGRVGAIGGAFVPGAGETGASEAVGGAVGAAVGGSATGSASGAALTEGTRQGLILAYRRKELKTWQDWAQATYHATMQTAKASTAAGIAGLAGPVAGRTVGMFAPEAVATTADIAANAATNTTVSAALDHRVPNAEDFFLAAGLVLGVHGMTSATGMGRGTVVSGGAPGRVAKNLEDIYIRTGIPPWEAAQRAQRDPVFKQEVYGQDVNGDPSHPRHTYAAPEQPDGFQTHEPGGFGQTNGAGKEPGETTVDENGEVVEPGKVTLGTLQRVGQIETGGLRNPDAAVSPKGAVGRFQIEPGTARQYGFDPSRLHDPEYNSMVARTILGDLNRRYGGNETAVMIGYNAGPGRASEYLSAGPGTRLEAVADKTVRGGIRYDRKPADRDESFLPMETQQYLAKARLYAGRPLNEGKPGEEEQEPFPGHDGAPSYEQKQEEFQREQQQESQEQADIERELYEPKTGAAGGAAATWEHATDEEVGRELLSNIGEQPSGDYATKSFLQDFGDRYVSELTSFKQLDQRLVDQGLLNRETDETAEDAMRRANYGARSTAAHIVKFGGVDATTWMPDKDIPSMFDAKNLALKAGGVGNLNAMDGWQAYMLARRTMDKAAAGVETGFNPMASASAMERPEFTKYEEASKVLTDAQNGVLKMLVDSGVITAASRDRMVAANPIYVSMRRVMGDNAPFSAKPRGVNGMLQEMQGSDNQIIKPFRSAVDNALVATKVAMRNQATGRVLAELQATPEIANLYGLKQVRASDPNADDIEEALRDAGVREEDMEQAREAFGSLVAERLNAKLTGNQFVFYRDGQREVWSIDDPVLAKAIRGAEKPQDAGFITKAMQVAARATRAGITIGTFPVRMTFWHQMNQFIMDPAHPPPVMTFFRGLMPALTESDSFQKLMASGGLVHIAQDLTTDELHLHMEADEDPLEQSGFWDKAWNTFKHPLEALEAVSTRLDAANRTGVMQHAEAIGQPPAKAAMTARRAGIDYAERGTSHVLSWMASVTPFLRPHVLGTMQGLESLRPANVAKTLAYGLAAVTMVKIANYMLNYYADQNLPDGQKYSDLPRWQRASQLVTPPIAGQRIQLRLPANVGFFLGAIPEYTLDAMLKHDPHAFDSMAGDFMHEFVGPMLPAVATPASEVIANHSWNTGRALIPDSLSNLLPEYQYEPNTSPTARALAGAVNPMVRTGHLGEGFSPIMFDHLVQGWTGQYGQAALGALDAALTHDTTDIQDVTSNLFFKGLVARTPGLSAQPLQDFYSELDHEKSVYASGRRVAKDETLGGEDAEAPSMSPKLQQLNQTAKAIQVQRSALRAIQDNTHMSLAEKRQASEPIIDQMIGLARTALDPHAAMQQAQGTGW